MWGCSERLNSASRYSCSYKSSRMFANLLLWRIATSICSSKCFNMGFIASCSRNSFRHLPSSDPYAFSQAMRTSSGLRKNIFEVYVVYKNLRSELIRRVPLNAFSLEKGYRGPEIGFEGMLKTVDQGKRGLSHNLATNSTPLLHFNHEQKIQAFRRKVRGSFSRAKSPTSINLAISDLRWLFFICRTIHPRLSGYFVSHLRQNTNMTSKPPPLNVSHPELAKEAVGWDPSEFTAGSGKKKTWKCSKGHLWDAPIYARTGSGKKPTGCPVCYGKIRIVGINDLETLHPEIASEADGWDPKTAGNGGGMRNWVCALGHRWSATISNRTFFNSKCPYCLNQKVWVGFNDLATTHPDLVKEAFGWDPTTVTAGSTSKKMTWRCLEGHTWQAFPDTRTRNKPSGCPTCANRVLEVGFNDLATTHPELAAEAFGWDPTTLVGGSHKVVKWKCKKGHTWETPVLGRSSKKRGCPICSNLFVQEGYNDLASNYPEIALEADGWDPSKVVFGTDQKMPWKCNLGHEWTTSVKHRTGSNPTNCPVCSGRKLLKGFNDLETTLPEVAREAFGWDPSLVSAGSHTKKLWKCQEGHTWEISPHGRKRGTVGCPTCSSSGFDPNIDAWLYFLKHEKWDMLQIGITNFPDQRLYRHKKNDWEVIEIRGPMDGYLTRDWETSILATLGLMGVKVGPSDVAGKFDGYTEAWRMSDYNPKSIVELMKAVTDQEGKTN